MRLPQVLRPLSLALLILMVLPPPAYCAAGRTPGSFAVSPTGAATYSIPIWTPPGPGGLQPNLSLVYNSQSGPGILGVGWSLYGLAAITRCNQTKAQDGSAASVTLTYADVFCINGNRLRLTSSSASYGQDQSTYQTEIADFSNITAHGVAGNGPAYFSVQSKDGRTYWYGNGGNSQVLATGTATATIWMLSGITDRAGNTLNITYAQPDSKSQGATVPSVISWTPTYSGSNAYVYTAQFNYGVNLPASSLVGYVSGTPIVNKNVLNSIVISGHGAVIKQYNFAYQISQTTGRYRLQSVTECADAQGSNCLLPTSISYQEGGEGFNSSATTVSVGSGADAFQSAQYDFNGDGYPDLITTGDTTGSCWNGGPGYCIRFGSAAGFQSSRTAVSSGSAVFYIAGTGYARDVPGALVGDVDGSGKDGLLVPYYYNSCIGSTCTPVAKWLYYSWSANNAYGGAVFQQTQLSLPLDTANGSFVLADVNGDGLPDLIHDVNGTLHVNLNFSGPGAPVFSATAIDTQVSCAGLSSHSTQQAGGLRSFDFDGDGRQDLICGNYALLSRGSGNNLTFVTKQITSNANTGSLPPYVQFYLRWNSDNCTDYVWGSNIYISGCDGSAPQVLQIGNGNLHVIGAMDFDGDGHTDVLVDNNGTLGIYLSRGDGIADTMIVTSIPTNAASGGRFFTFDADGDGLDDLAYYSTAAPASLSYWTHVQAGTPPDLLTSIADGYGIAASPTYVSKTYYNYTSASSLRASGNDPCWATILYTGGIADNSPLYVVDQFSASDGIGGSYQNKFWYYGAQSDWSGRGSLGFYAKRSYDTRSGVYKYECFGQKFPFAGVLLEEHLRDNAIELGTYHSILERTSTPQATTLDATSGNGRVFPYLSSIATSIYEVTAAMRGALIADQEMDYVYDGFGNVTSLTTTITDDDSTSPLQGKQWITQTNNSISADISSNWCLSLPTKVQITNTAPSSPAITRTVGFTPDYVNCRQTQQIVEPGSSTYQVTTTYSFDMFGNVNRVTVGGVGVPAVPTGINWNITGQFPESITDAMNETTWLNYDLNFGQPSQVSDPNGVQTLRHYDGFGRPDSETAADGTKTVWAYTDCASGSGCLVGSHALTVQATTYNADGSIKTDATEYLDQQDRTLVSTSRLLGTGAYSRVDTRYDNQGRTLKQSSPCIWAALGTACPYWAVATYDLLDRPVLITRPASQTDSTPVAWSIAYKGDTTVTTDPDGKQATEISAPVGLVQRTQDHDGYAMNFAYDSFGGVTAVSDSLGNVIQQTTYDYGQDAYPRVQTDMDRGKSTYQFDSLGELISWTQPNVNSTSSSADVEKFTARYDALSRLIELDTSDTDPNIWQSVSKWTWGGSATNHNIGKLVSQSVYQVDSDGNAGTPVQDVYSYDSLGRLAQQSEPVSGLQSTNNVYTWTYDSNSGLLDTITYPTSPGSYQFKLKYGYQNGLLHQIDSVSESPSVTVWVANAVDAAGRVTQETRGNGIVVNRSFDAVTGRLAGIQAAITGRSPVVNQSYLYDAVGNLIQRQDNSPNRGLTENFYYDDLHRLSYSTLNGSTNLSLTYDAMGNIVSRSDVSGGATWNYDSVHKHRVNSIGGGAAYTYSASGNLVGRQGEQFDWLPGNRLFYVGDGSASASFGYRADGHRAYESFTDNLSPNYVAEELYYVGDLQQQVWSAAQGSASDDYRHYVYAAGVPIAVYSRMTNGTNTWHYLVEDHQGSLASITDSTGAATASESFTAFGLRRDPNTWTGVLNDLQSLTSDSIAREGYTFAPTYEALGITHLNGRVLDSTLGRFLSPDPFTPDPSNTQDFNRYGYARNNPVTRVDPSGFDDDMPTVYVLCSSCTVESILSSNPNVTFIGYEDGYPTLLVHGGGEHGQDEIMVISPVFSIPSSAFRSPSAGAQVPSGGSVLLTLPDILENYVGFTLIADSNGSRLYVSPGYFGLRSSYSGGSALWNPILDGYNSGHYASGQASGPPSRPAAPSGGPAYIAAPNVSSSSSTASLPQQGWLSSFVYNNLIRPSFGIFDCVGGWCSNAQEASLLGIAAVAALPIGRFGGGSLAARGGLAAVRAGQAGEAAVRSVYDIGEKIAIEVNGRTRIPDGLLPEVLSEVKNVKSLSYTKQLRDFADFAQATGIRFDLYLRPGARLSRPLQDVIDDGLINRIDIPQ